jgi:hypothetical protein
MPNIFKIGDPVRVPEIHRYRVLPDRIKFMADGRVETVTQVGTCDWDKDIQLVSVDLFEPDIGAGWFELAKEDE